MKYEWPWPDLKCDTCGHTLKDEGPLFFGNKSWDCWCGGKLTNSRIQLLERFISPENRITCEADLVKLVVRSRFDSVGSMTVFDNTSKPEPAWLKSGIR